MEEGGDGRVAQREEGTRPADETVWTNDEPVWHWESHKGTAADMKQGSWVLMGDEARRVMKCKHSTSGIRRTRKVHFILDNGMEDIVPGTTKIRTRVHNKDTRFL